MPRIIGIFLTLALAGAQTSFQQANSESVIRITVNLVQVDAVVTDSKGKPVTNLKKEDFVILQDGKPQVITNFSYVTSQPGTVQTAAVRTAGKGVTAPPPPPKASGGGVPKQVRRTFALVVDDLGLSFESMAHIRDSLKKFVDQQMQPGDLVAVMRTSAGMGALQQFTSDKRILYAAIDKVKYNSLGRVGVSSFAPLQEVIAGAPDTTNFDNEREQIFAAGTMGAIQYVVEGLRELPGRKSVIVFSEHMKINYQDGMSSRVMDSIKRLTDAANRSSVVIYTIDPRGVVYTGLTAADNTRGRTPQELSRIPMQRSQQMWESQDGLVLLAKETGGLFLHDSNDIGSLVKQVVDDSEGYYLIGYHPDASTFDSKTGQPKFHSLSVRVKQSGTHVRYRSGFFGTSDRAPAPPPQDRHTQIARALWSPFSTGALHLRLTSLFAESPKNGPFVVSLLYFDPRELQFVDEPDDWHKAVIDTVCVTVGDSGQIVDSTDKTWTVRLKGDAYRNMLQKGLVYRLNVAIKKPGAYQMRVVLRDSATQQLGSASQFIQVPDINKGHLELGGIMLSGDTPKPAEAAAMAAENAEGHVNEPDPNATPAVRIFKPGTPILYGYQVLNAQSDSSKKTSLEVQTRLYRDGEEVYVGKPNPLEPGPTTDPKLLVAGGRMQLGSRVAAGDYVLQVIVTDKLAKEKYQVATQSMDFEIRP
jgi:VWFA-related protein